MEGEAFEETVQGVGTAVGEVWTEAVASDVFHFVLVWEWGNGALGVFAAEVFVEEHEVCEASADLASGFLEGCEVSLYVKCQLG